MSVYLPLPPGGHTLLVDASVAPSTARLWTDGATKRGVVAGGAHFEGQGVARQMHWRFTAVSSDSTLAELLALEAALGALTPGMLEGGAVYTDSYQAMEHLSKCQEGGPSRYTLLDPIWGLLRGHRVREVRNIDRRHNRNADLLAKKGLPFGRR